MHRLWALVLEVLLLLHQRIHFPQIIVTKEYLHLEPIGIVLVFFFFAIVVIQFIAMLFHRCTQIIWSKSEWYLFFSRFGTISHILASTDLNCCTKKEDVLSDEALIEKNAVEIVKQMQRLKGIDGDYDSDSAASNRLAQRHTIQVTLSSALQSNNSYSSSESWEKSAEEASYRDPWCCVQETFLCSFRYFTPGNSSTVKSDIIYTAIFEC